MSGVTETAVIGREPELRAVERFLDRSRKGSAALLIEGEAGIGKTSIWAEAVRSASARGFRVLQARPAETEVRLSYAALSDLVGSDFEETQAVLPPLQRRALAAALLRSDTDEPADPRTAATAVASLLTALAAEGPVLLAIDDVQWLDPGSEQALAFAARRLPPRLGLLLTRRTDGGGDPPLGLGRALPADGLEHIAPGPLSLAALHHLIRGRLGTSLPRPLLVRLAAASGGNPFFALEIARALAEDTGDRAAGEPLPVPRSLDELVAARVQALSPAARQTALVSAALSRPTVALVTGTFDEGDARAALVEAEEAGVLVIERGHIRFAHPLLASVVYGSASPERRRQLHERLAAAVADLEERARHLALSATEADETIAMELEQAAALAAKRGAQQAAAELFEASRRLTPDEMQEELTRRLLGEAAAQLAAGDVGGARSAAERTVELARVGAQRAQGLLLLGEIAWITGSRTVGEQLERALAAADGDPALAARIYPKLVNFTVAHDPARAVEYAEAAMRLLRAEREPGALAYVVFDRLWAGAMLGHGVDWKLFERWQELEAKAGRAAPKTPIPMIFFHSIDDFEAARGRYAVEDEWFRDRGEDGWRAERLSHLSYVELRAGRLQLAERYAEESCAAVAQIEGPGPWAIPLRFRSFVDVHRGRIERARETLLRMIEESERAGRAFWAALNLSTLGYVEFTAGNHQSADDALRRMRKLTDAIGTRDLVPDRSEPFHVESLTILGEVERAREALERLEERGRVFPRIWITATLPRARALVLAAEGDAAAGLAALDELDVEVAAKVPFELAWARLVQGRLHRRIKQKRAAADALGQALELFERLGDPTWVEQTRAELGRVGLRRAPSELTPTERRVAELAASGLTNREVATAAFMSPKTVQANLARVYRKLGIRSRAELGARMADEQRNAQT